MASVLADVLVFPALLVYWLSLGLARGRREQVFQGFGQMFSMLPGLPGEYLRRAFYRHSTARCSRSCSIGFGTLLTSTAVEIGEHVYIGANCTIGFARIGDDVLIGSNVDILSGKHQHYFDRLDLPIRKQGGRLELVTIGADAWIGNGAIVAEAVGEHAIVAAGAVVVKPVPPLAIVAGNPARVIGTRGEPAATDPLETSGPLE